MTELSNFNKIVLSKFAKSITNSVFLMIQNDKALMREYLKLVHKHNVKPVNMSIGKAIKDTFNLNNFPGRENKPTSTLIQSHQKF